MASRFVKVTFFAALVAFIAWILAKTRNNIVFDDEQWDNMGK